MTDLKAAAAVLAALEVSPGRPSDLTRIVANPGLRHQLLTGADDSDDPLVNYLAGHGAQDRRDAWRTALAEWVPGGGRPVLSGDAGYPHLLSRCWDAPPIIFVRGRLPAPETATVAVVGSRRTDEQVLEQTASLAAALSEEGTCVISGLAIGVDGAAHMGTLAARGHTVAVLGTGLELDYPKEHAALKARIKHEGGLVSQFPPYAPPTGSTFLMRNHLIAGLSETSIVMDASVRSGSRYEANMAMEYGRKVLYWAPTLQSQTWARQDVDQGRATFVASIAEAVAAA